jgi:GT2 family glycosyltransferase
MIPPHRADLPARSEADQASFFAEVLESAHQAARQVDPIEHQIELAGIHICLRFAGPALERQLMPALSHRIVTADTLPTMTIHVWDSESTGVVLSGPPVEKYCLSERGDIWTFDSRRYRSAFHYSEFSLNLMDLVSGQAVFWVNSANKLAYWTIASPFRTLFHWCAEQHGAQLVHAAAVGIDGKGALITGRGGVGKSSTALTCVEAGFDYVGDDYVLLTIDGGTRAHSIYRTAKVERQDVARYPRLADGPEYRIANAGDNAKAVLYLSDCLVNSVSIAAVLSPQIGQADSACVEPVDSNYLLGAASYTTVAQLPHAGPQTTAFLEKMLHQTPGRKLVLGRDRGSAATVLRALLEQRLADEPTCDAVAPMPLVSIIIPVFNGLRFLPEAMASILAQDHPAIEVILVDDGSPDDVPSAAELLPIQPRVLRQHNQGPAAARNLGIRAASGEILAFLDVDDLWPDRMLATCIRWLLDHPATDVVTGRAQLFRDQAGQDPGFAGSPSESFDNYIGAAVFRRRAFERAGLFDPLLRFAEDSDWFGRAPHLGATIDRIEMTTLFVRRHDANMTKDLEALDLVPLRMLKNSLDLKRAAQAHASGLSPA